MATLTKVILTEAEPVKQTTERDKSYFVDGRLFQINVASLDATGGVVANTGLLTGKWKGVDAGFAVSDHADWEGLLQAVKATEAEKVYVTHGSQAVFSKYLNEIGIEAHELKTEFGEDELETSEQLKTDIV